MHNNKKEKNKCSNVYVNASVKIAGTHLQKYRVIIKNYIEVKFIKTVVLLHDR